MSSFRRFVCVSCVELGLPGPFAFVEHPVLEESSTFFRELGSKNVVPLVVLMMRV